MLRPYQIEAARQINLYFNQVSRRVILRMPTGAGKTTVFSHIIKNWSGPVLMVVRGRKLVDQASERLTREGVDHDILMAGRYNPRSSAKPVAVASIDTLKWRKIVPEATLIVIDECHLARTDTFDELFSNYPNAYFLGVTATPFNPKGFKPIADAIIEVVRVPELIAAGFLVPMKYYASERPDLTTVKKTAGEYAASDLAVAMNQARLRGPVVATWKRLGESRPTLVFAVNVDHSKSLAEEFNRAGILAAHVDASCSTAERDSVLTALSDGRLQVVCSVGVLITGVDLPPVSCIVVCRPTLSYPTHVQMLGRGARPHENKHNCIVLDHAGNLERHGFYESHREASLDGKVPPFRVVTNRCEKCYFIWTPSGNPACPGIYPDGTVCNYVKPYEPPKPKKIKTDESVSLVELSPEELERRQRDTWIDAEIKKSAEAGHKPGAAYYKIQSRYGAMVARASWGKIHAGFRVEDN